GLVTLGSGHLRLSALGPAGCRRQPRPRPGGGGTANNDGRFMHQHGRWQDGDEGALTYLIKEAAKQQPFFLIVSLVNPHDVLFYPSSYKDNGYDNRWLLGDIGVPETID